MNLVSSREISLFVNLFIFQVGSATIMNLVRHINMYINLHFIAFPLTGISLLEAQVEYVPNDICRAKEGVIGTGDFVKYESRLTDNMMCAMDEDGERGDGSTVVDEDTCVGDSGGPMIMTPNGGSNGLTEDLQVGLVSWGIGCASVSIYMNIMVVFVCCFFLLLFA